MVAAASRLLQACTRHRPQPGPTPRPPAAIAAVPAPRSRGAGRPRSQLFSRSAPQSPRGARPPVAAEPGAGERGRKGRRGGGPVAGSRDRVLGARRPGSARAAPAPPAELRRNAAPRPRRPCSRHARAQTKQVAGRRRRRGRAGHSPSSCSAGLGRPAAGTGKTRGLLAPGSFPPPVNCVR